MTVSPKEKYRCLFADLYGVMAYTKMSHEDELDCGGGHTHNPLMSLLAEYAGVGSDMMEMACKRLDLEAGILVLGSALLSLLSGCDELGNFPPPFALPP